MRKSVWLHKLKESQFIILEAKWSSSFRVGEYDFNWQDLNEIFYSVIFGCVNYLLRNITTGKLIAIFKFLTVKARQNIPLLSYVTKENAKIQLQRRLYDKIVSILIFIIFNVTIIFLLLLDTPTQTVLLEIIASPNKKWIICARKLSM